MKKTGKLLCALFAAILLLMGLASASAAERMIHLGTGGIADGDAENAAWDRVYFGSRSGTPLKWRVLSKDGNDGSYKLPDGSAFDGKPLLLLTEQTIGNSCFEDQWQLDDGDGQDTPAAWQNCYAQTWLKENFMDDTFSDAEKGLVLKTTKTDGSLDLFDTGWGGGCLIDEEVFFLSVEEAAAYLGSTGKAPGLIATDASGNYVAWWLRTKHWSLVGEAGLVGDRGDVYPYYVNAWEMHYRPALNLDASSVLFTSETEGVHALTLLDKSRSFALADTGAKATFAGKMVSLDYCGGVTGENEFISALLLDGTGTVVDYAQLAAAGESGRVSYTVPADMVAGTYTLSLFNEQYNGEQSLSFSSGFASVTLTVKKAAYEIAEYRTRGTKAAVTVSLPKGGQYSVVFVDYEGKKFRGIDIVTVEIVDGEVRSVLSEKDLSLGKNDKILLWSGVVPLCGAFAIQG